ncbi:MAG: hypothetical protein ACREYA_33455 [Cupriavidus necator]
MKTFFHHPNHPQLPHHGVRYYLLLCAGLVVLGILYGLGAR